jgi:hypothetical protein
LNSSSSVCDSSASANLNEDAIVDSDYSMIIVWFNCERDLAMETVSSCLEYSSKTT